MFRNFLNNIGVVAGGFILTGVISFVFAWSEPTLLPPSKSAGEAPEPINISSNAQTKSGNFTISGDLTATQFCLGGTCKSSWPTSNCQRVYYSQDESGSGATTQYCSWQLKGIVDDAGNAQNISPPTSLPITGYMVCCNYLQ